MKVRPALVRLHRYAGLALALFLTVAGLTGSIIAFNDELDGLLNPELFEAHTPGKPLATDALIARVEKQLPGASVSLVPMHLDQGEAAQLRVEPKGAAMLDYDQVFADPVTGKVLGTRPWGQFAFKRSAVMPFIYLLHYTLTLPGVWGVLLMGIVACIWAIDCFVGFALTLPRGKPFWTKWKTSWRVKQGAGTYRLNLDLHRAGGLWLWLLLLMMAVSGVSLNLNEQVFRPVLSLIATLSPSPIEQAAARASAKPEPAKLSFGDAETRAIVLGRERGWAITPRIVFHYAAYNAYGVGFTRGSEDGENGMGQSYFYIDDRDGSLLAKEVTGEGTAGDVFAQAQFPLHSGRIIGLPGRIIISLLGLCVAGLSMTGVYIWLRKRHFTLPGLALAKRLIARLHTANSQTVAAE